MEGVIAKGIIHGKNPIPGCKELQWLRGAIPVAGHLGRYWEVLLSPCAPAVVGDIEIRLVRPWVLHCDPAC